MKLALLVLLLCASPFAHPSNESFSEPYFSSAASYPSVQYPASEPQIPEPEGGRLWVPAPPLPSAAETSPVPYGAPQSKFGSLYEQLRSPNHAGPPDAGESYAPYNGRESETQFFEGYRFRRREQDQEAPEGIWYQGYRFRPLTEQERARMQATPGWRPWEKRPRMPREPARSLPRSGERRPRLSPKEEDWFHRHFGRQSF